MICNRLSPRPTARQPPERLTIPARPWHFSICSRVTLRCSSHWPTSTRSATTQQSIGDVLSTNNMPGKYYGGGFNADGTTSPSSSSYCNICNPFEYQASYPAMVADHMRDITDLFTDLKNGTLPAVSYVKPD